MKLLTSVSIALTLAGLPAAAIAQVNQSYSYDANGRLSGVSVTGPGGTNTDAYVYDDAHNRTSRSQTGTTAWAALSRLPVGDDLQPHQALVSPDRRSSLAGRDTGPLELWSDRSVVWSSMGEGSGPDFILDRASHARFRGPGSGENPVASAWLAHGDNGDLSLLDAAGSAVVWRWTPNRDPKAVQ